MASVARQGSLGERDTAWLAKGRHGYYRLSLLHRILRPCALHLLAVRRLTHVDQGLDPGIARQIETQRIFYEMLSDHYDLAAAEPQLTYQPDGSKELEQGVPLGGIDKAADFLIERDAEGRERILELGWFEARLSSNDGPGADSVRWLSSRFDNFHPATHPVLWRALVASAGLAWVLTKLSMSDESDPRQLAKQFFRDPKVADKLDWRGDEEFDAKATDTPEGAIRAAEAHILNRLMGGDPLS